MQHLSWSGHVHPLRQPGLGWCSPPWSVPGRTLHFRNHGLHPGCPCPCEPRFASPAEPLTLQSFCAGGAAIYISVRRTCRNQRHCRPGIRTSCRVGCRPWGCVGLRRMRSPHEIEEPISPPDQPFCGDELRNRDPMNHEVRVVPRPQGNGTRDCPGMSPPCRAT